MPGGITITGDSATAGTGAVTDGCNGGEGIRAAEDDRGNAPLFFRDVKEETGFTADASAFGEGTYCKTGDKGGAR